MMDEERRKSNEGETDSDERNHPLSREGWIMLLSGEINNLHMANLALASISFACALACLAGIIAFMIREIICPDYRPTTLAVFAFFFIFLLLRHCLTTLKKVNHTERIRKGIILENEGFKTYDEIRDQCKNAGVILKRK